MTAAAARESLGVSESAFQAAVIDYAEKSGWMVAHFADSRREIVDRRTGERRLVGDTQAAGFPDLTMVRDGRLIFAELKADSGKVSERQENWLWALSQLEEACGEHVEVHVWRPVDWPQIERVLARRFR